MIAITTSEYELTMDLMKEARNTLEQINGDSPDCRKLQHALNNMIVAMDLIIHNMKWES